VSERARNIPYRPQKNFEKKRKIKKKCQQKTHPDFFLDHSCEKTSMFCICGVKVLLIDPGLGWNDFWGAIKSQSDRREASTLSILDFLDTFSVTNRATETLNPS
jgi:hypothetical protein